MTQEFGNQENKLKGDYASVEGSLKLMQSPGYSNEDQTALQHWTYIHHFLACSRRILNTCKPKGNKTLG